MADILSSLALFGALRDLGAWAFARPRVKITVMWGSIGNDSQPALFFRMENPTSKAIAGARLAINTVSHRSSTNLVWDGPKPTPSQHLSFAPREVKSHVAVRLPDHVIERLIEDREIFVAVRIIGDQFDQRRVFHLSEPWREIKRVKWHQSQIRKRARKWAATTKLDDREREVPNEPSEK